MPKVKVSVHECPAGPELDAAVAKARGWLESSDGYWMYPDGKKTGYKYRSVFMDDSPYYRPSVNIAIAEELWNELAEDHWVVSVCYGPGRDGTLYASVQMQVDAFLAEDLMSRNPRDMDTTAKTKPLAITRAYLKAKGVEFIEVSE